MQDVISFGKRLVPLEQIVFIEPFDPTRNPDFKSEKEFKARVALLNRETVLTEATPREFAEANGMRYLDEDDMAVNPAIALKVETFTATEDFKPERAFQTRLKWRDRNGNEQSKLLVTGPEAVIATVLREGIEPRPAAKAPARRPAAGRSSRRSARKAESVQP